MKCRENWKDATPTDLNRLVYEKNKSQNYKHNKIYDFVKLKKKKLPQPSAKIYNHNNRKCSHKRINPNMLLKTRFRIFYFSFVMGVWLLAIDGIAWATKFDKIDNIGDDAWAG